MTIVIAHLPEATIRLVREKTAEDRTAYSQSESHTRVIIHLSDHLEVYLLKYRLSLSHCSARNAIGRGCLLNAANGPGLLSGPRRGEEQQFPSGEGVFESDSGAGGRGSSVSEGLMLTRF